MIANECVVAVSTPAVTKSGDVTATARSLLRQTLQLWEWNVGGDPGTSDPRINPASPADESAYAALVDSGVELAPTVLEQHVWHLETHPGLDATCDSGVVVWRTRLREPAGARGAAELTRRLRAAGAVVAAGAELMSGSESETARTVRLTHPPVAWIPEQLPFRNPLPKSAPRMFLMIPWMEVGGADRFNLNLLEAAHDAGWEVTVVATLSSHQPWRDQFERLTDDIVALPGLIPLLDQPRFLHYLLDSRRPDVVLMSNSELAYRFLPHLRSVADATFIDYCHSDSPTWNSGGYPRLSVQFHGQLDLTLTASEYLRGWMTKRGSDPERIRVAYVGVDIDEFHPDENVRRRVRSELRLPDGTPTVLFVGRVDADKQPDVLVEALRLLAADRVDFNAVIAGSGPAVGLLRSLIRSRGLSSRTRLLGAVDPDRVSGLMCAADVLVLPSRWEGVALTLYEAMACGIPVVATDVGGQRELVTPDSGVLVPRSTASEEARAIAKALAGILREPERRAAMGEAASLRATQLFPITATTKQLFDGIDEARRLHDRDPRPPLPRGAALASVVDAVELLRMQVELVAGWRFMSRGRISDHLRIAFLVAAQRWLGHAYRRGASHRRLGFVAPMKEAVVRILLPRSRD
jgi:glycosyltransferase involved in cell wall biosynthesis